MGKIKINETASEPIDMKKGSNTNEEPTELIMPIEHYVTVSAKVENPDAGASVEGVKSAPRKKSTGAKANANAAGAATKTTNAAGRKKALALPEGSIGAAVIDEKAKAADAGTKKAAKAGAVGASGAASVAGATGSTGAKKASMDGMVKPKARTVEVTEIETTAEEEFEAHRPREKKEDDEPEEEEKPRFSKPKALLIGAGVTLAVALVGGLAVALLGHKDVPRCVVQFESNGGSKVESEEVVCGETVERPSDPTKDGFAFQDWIYGGVPFDFGQTTIDEDMILVAKWQVKDGVEIVKVTFDTAGGSEIESVELKKGGTISEPVEPTRTSYEFAGWKLNGEDFDFSRPIEEDTTLVAEWTPIAGGNGGGQSSGGSTTPEKPRVESLAVADASMKVGTPSKFDVTIKPSNAEVKLGVSSSDPNIVTCSLVEDNRLQCEAKAPGEATIMVRDSLTGKNTQFKLTVTADVTFVKLDKASVTLYTGETTTLVATVSPENATNKKVTWSTSNPNVVTVANGKLTAVATGTATITVKTANGIEASCTVTVNSRPVTPPVVDPDPKPGEGGDGDEGDDETGSDA